jgi:hypothetical protein
MYICAKVASDLGAVHTALIREEKKIPPIPADGELSGSCDREFT